MLRRMHMLCIRQMLPKGNCAAVQKSACGFFIMNYR